MGLQDRDYMRRLRSLGSPPSGNGSGGLRYLWIAAIAIGVASSGFYLYKNIRESMTPGEGDLVVNVNSATQTELETIPGIGSHLAKPIIAGRPYGEIEELERVRGIGHYTLNSIRPYVKVVGETQER